MAEMRLLYGEVITDVLRTGDKELMAAVAKVSNYLLSKVKGSDEGISAWKKAHTELEKALGG